MAWHARSNLVLPAMLLCVATAVTARTRPPTVAPTPTATPFTCDGVEFPEPILDFQFSVEPPQPVVGDTVVVTVSVRNTNGGFVGRPEIGMSSSVPVVSGLTRGGPFHWSPVAFELMAVQPGTTELRVGLTYEARTGCCGYCYTPGGRSSPPFPLTIGGGEALPDLIPEYLLLAPVGGEPGCAADNPDRTPIATEVCVRNVGGAAAGPFVLAKDQQSVRVDGLAAGGSTCAEGFLQERYTSTAFVHVDVDDEVRERDENNNQKALPAAVPTPLPVCDTPTITPIPAHTPTAECAGDCDASGQVRVDELVRGVHMALADGGADACAAFDMNHDARVSVNELVGAVDAALRGCAAPTPTATPTFVSLATPTRPPLPVACCCSLYSFPECQGVIARRLCVTWGNVCPGVSTPTPTPTATPRDAASLAYEIVDHIADRVCHGPLEADVRVAQGADGLPGATLTCNPGRGHHGVVTMYAYPSATDARNAFEAHNQGEVQYGIGGGITRIAFSVPPCCSEGLSQTWAWVRDCWLVVGESFDDTLYLSSPQPRAVVEAIVESPNSGDLPSSCR